MRRSRLLAIAVSTCVSLIVVVAYVPHGAVAAAKSGFCTTTSGARFAGYGGYVPGYPQTAEQTPEGVSAYITTRPSLQCTGGMYPAQFSTDWVMIEDRITNSLWLQSGHIWTSSNCQSYFQEWNSKTIGHYRQTTGACASLGGAYQYWDLYQGPAGYNPPCCNTFWAYAGGFSAYPSFDPWHEGWSFNPEYEGEVDDTGIDMPGTNVNRVNFTQMGIQSVSDGVNRLVPCELITGGTAGTRYHVSALSCTSIQNWTDPL